MSHFFQNTAITGGVPQVMSFLNDQFLSESWSSLHLNTTASVPSAAGINTYCFAWKSNGRTGSIGDIPAHHWVMMRWGFDNQSDSHLWYTCASAAKVVPSGTISKTSDTALVSASSPHNLRVGDILFVHGTGDSDFHNGWEGDDDPLVVTTIINANQFNYEDTDGPVNISAVGYSNILALYNAKGSFSNNENIVPFGMGELGGNIYTPNDNPLNWNVYGYVDEYRMACVLETGGKFGVFYGGLIGRGHIPNSWKHVGALTASITGTGAPMLLGLDRNCPSMSVGQPIWLVPPNEATGSKTGSFGSPRAINTGNRIATASAKPFDNVVEVQIANGAQFGSGTLVGFDPAPCILIGFDGVNQNLQNWNATCVHYANGTNDQVLSPTRGFEDDSYTPQALIDGNLEVITDPAEYGTGSTGIPFQMYWGWDIGLDNVGTVVGDEHGFRYPLVGFVAWSQGDQNDGDLMVVGQNIAANRWKVFPSFLAGNQPATTTLGVGPGAS